MKPGYVRLCQERGKKLSHRVDLGDISPEPSRPRLHPRDQFWRKTYSPSREPGFTMSPQAPTDRGPSRTRHITACPHLMQHSTHKPLSPCSSAGKAACGGISFLRRAFSSEAATRTEGCLQGICTPWWPGSPPTPGDTILQT